ncbi:MAG: hypothetical protein EI684_16905 [Candidatus Viridilinea halotolerans]|uniref:Uncharacterized protein n=1 Tax=Candidatus Viridilinea halotolerans TaxID=2491704 RepID=A0A426TUN5_9CHLR|nr:MAG: hypothetical protein EI684_16905 [Candidatus Viridilinea halotolerans]
MSRDPSAPALSPHEQLPIPLFDGVVLAVRSGEGLIFSPRQLRDWHASRAIGVMMHAFAVAQKQCC